MLSLPTHLRYDKVASVGIQPPRPDWQGEAQVGGYAWVCRQIPSASVTAKLKGGSGRRGLQPVGDKAFLPTGSNAWNQPPTSHSMSIETFSWYDLFSPWYFCTKIFSVFYKVNVLRRKWVQLFGSQAALADGYILFYMNHFFLKWCIIMRARKGRRVMEETGANSLMQGLKSEIAPPIQGFEPPTFWWQAVSSTG